MSKIYRNFAAELDKSVIYITTLLINFLFN